MIFLGYLSKIQQSKCSLSLKAKSLQMFALIVYGLVIAQKSAGHFLEKLSVKLVLAVLSLYVFFAASLIEHLHPLHSFQMSALVLY